MGSRVWKLVKVMRFDFPHQNLSLLLVKYVLIVTILFGELRASFCLDHMDDAWAPGTGESAWAPIYHIYIYTYVYIQTLLIYLSGALNIPPRKAKGLC